MPAARVLIATPNRPHCKQAASLIAGLPGFVVAATASDLSETFNHAEILVPDVVLIAEEFTRMEEFSVMITLFAALGTGWVLLSPNGAAASAASEVNMRSGSPSKAFVSLDLSQNAPHWAQALRSACAGPRPTLSRPAFIASPPPETATQYNKVVVIGSSTGGVDALIMLLASFPADCPPTAIVQHTGRGFSDSLVQLLQRRCKPRIVAAQDGLALEHGMVCLAGGVAGHLVLLPGKPPRCQIRPGEPVSGHIPSIDMLFRSAASLAPQVVGTILTGMGQDGATGLLELRRAGAFTIGQDEASSVVYGMPKAAWDRGAVQLQLPLPQIGEQILRAAASTFSQAERRVATG